MLVNRGKGKIFDTKFLDEQGKKNPAFYAREYLGQYGYGLGNVFLHDEIEKCCQLFKPIIINHNAPISMGIDPGFGSSKFAVTILQLEYDILRVIYAKEFDRPSYEDMIHLVSALKVQYRPGKIYVDGAKPDYIKSLKSLFNESVEYDKVIQRAKTAKVDYDKWMYVVPVSFAEHGKELLGRYQQFVSKGWFAISPVEHKELVTQMRMARLQDNGNLDKKETGDSTFDSFDATRLALYPFNTGGKR